MLRIDSLKGERRLSNVQRCFIAEVHPTLAAIGIVGWLVLVPEKHRPVMIVLQ